jgi:hypothetical protein
LEDVAGTAEDGQRAKPVKTGQPSRWSTDTDTSGRNRRGGPKRGGRISSLSMCSLASSGLV